jgi:hypothetical protein
MVGIGLAALGALVTGCAATGTASNGVEAVSGARATTPADSIVQRRMFQVARNVIQCDPLALSRIRYRALPIPLHLAAVLACPDVRI